MLILFLVLSAYEMKKWNWKLCETERMVITIKILPVECIQPQKGLKATVPFWKIGFKYEVDCYFPHIFIFRHWSDQWRSVGWEAPGAKEEFVPPAFSFSPKVLTSQKRSSLISVVFSKLFIPKIFKDSDICQPISYLRFIGFILTWIFEYFHLEFCVPFPNFAPGRATPSGPPHYATGSVWLINIKILKGLNPWVTSGSWLNGFTVRCPRPEDLVLGLCFYVGLFIFISV